MGPDNYGPMYLAKAYQGPHRSSRDCMPRTAGPTKSPASGSSSPLEAACCQSHMFVVPIFHDPISWAPSPHDFSSARERVPCRRQVCFRIIPLVPASTCPIFSLALAQCSCIYLGENSWLVSTQSLAHSTAARVASDFIACGDVD